MTAIRIDRSEVDAITHRVQRYFREQLEQEIGRFDAEFLLDFFIEEIGPRLYNRGLYDARAVLERRIEDIGDAILELEQAPRSDG